MIVNNTKLVTDETPNYAGSMPIAGSKLIGLSIAYGSVSSILCNSVSLTKAYSDTSTKSGWELAVWYLDSPTTGGSVSISATFSSAVYFALWDVDDIAKGTYLDVDADNASSVTVIDAAVSALENGGSFSLVHEHVTSTGSFTATGDQSEDNEDTSNASGHVLSAGESDTHEWTTESDTLTVIAVSFGPLSDRNGLFFGTGF